MAAKPTLNRKGPSHTRTEPHYSRQDVEGDTVDKKDSRSAWGVGLHSGQIQPYGEEGGLLRFPLRSGWRFLAGKRQEGISSAPLPLLYYDLLRDCNSEPTCAPADRQQWRLPGTRVLYQLGVEQLKRRAKHCGQLCSVLPRLSSLSACCIHAPVLGMLL